MRIMAIDYGDQRIGLAVSDLLGTIAGEAWTLHEWDAERAARTIVRECADREVERLVLGLPGTWTAPGPPGGEEPGICRAAL
jgi:putative Holliday junction resolvase